MIFITVGTTNFDSLIRTIDNLVENGNIYDEVIAQIGNGYYIPKHIKSFRLARSLLPFIKKSELIISHGGALTIFECLELKKKLIVVENPEVRGRHQRELAKELSEKKYLIWCKHYEKLLDCIEKSKRMQFHSYSPPKCSISEKIIDFLIYNY